MKPLPRFLRLLTPLALAPAALAQTLECGQNDFPISAAGTPGEAAVDATRPSVAHDPTRQEFLVVWQADDDTSPLVNNEFEIYGQFLDANGAPLGSPLRLSTMGTDGDAAYDAFRPAVAYNSGSDEYLVVWRGKDDDLTVPQFEIYGQRVDPSTRLEIGTDDFRISDMGPDDDVGFNANNPNLVYNPVDDEYLVVWEADDDQDGLVNDKIEIFGQRLDTTGAEIGTNDFRISQTTDGGAWDSIGPDVAYSSATGGYLVAWRAAESNVLFRQIRCQLLDAEGEETGPNDFDFDTTFNVYGTPGVASDGPGGEFLVAWGGQGNDFNGQVEVYAERVDGFTGSNVGGTITVSDFDLNGFDHNGIEGVHASFSAERNAYLVTWHSFYYNDPPDFDISDFFEVYGQWIVAGTGLEIGAEDFAISDAGTGPNNFGSFLHEAKFPSAAIAGGKALVVWEASQDYGDYVQGEFEIFGQLLSSPLQAAEEIRLGTPANPNAFLAGQTSRPVLGATWDPVVDHTTFLPDATLDLALSSPTPINAVTGFGTLLCSFPFYEVAIEFAGTPFSFTIPNDACVIGLEVCTQAASRNASGWHLANAIDITLGSF